jgi:hypothetical protein
MIKFSFILKICTIAIIQFFPYVLFSQNQYLARVIQPDPISTPSICMVGVNSDNKNVVIWNKPVSDFIAYFKIYRESTMQTNKWDSIGTTDYSKTSMFIDPASEPSKQSYRYKISSVDKCGNETSLSSVHKTMNLSILKNINNSYSLIWDEYEGFTVSSYRIYRGSTKNDLTLIGSVTAGNFNYNDDYVPAGAIYYQVEVISPNDCDVTITKSTSATSSSRSNVASNIISGIHNLTSYSEIKIIPNPLTQKATIYYPNPNHQLCTLSLFDITGKKVYTRDVSDEKFEFEKGNLSKGLYFIEIKGLDTFKSKLIIAE